MRILLVLLLAGCATNKLVNLPDGSMGHSITCSGTALTWNACYEKAGELCKEKGYEVVTGGAEQGVVVAGSQYGVYGSSTHSRSMLIKCK